MNKIELGDNQTALILNEDLSFELHIPNGDDEEMVPESALYVIAIAVLLKNEDEEFFKILNKQMEEFYSLELVEDEE